MFSRFFIYRPVFACVVSIVIVLIGAITIPFLPVESVPDITPPTVVVSTTYPGASATVVAETVASPLEEQINGVEDMIYMSSKSSDDGTMSLTVTFEVGTDIDMATVLVQNRVAMAESKLPEEVKREGVTVEKKSTSMTLVVNVLSPEGQYDEIYISNYINIRVKDVLARVPGVGSVLVFGAKDYGMRIWMDPEKLAARALTVNDVVDAIRAQNIQVAAGQIGAPPSPKGQEFQYTVNTLGRLRDVEQFEEMIVKVGEDGRLLRVGDVARVELGAQLYNSYAQLDGAPSLAVIIYQLPGANALGVAEGVKQEMERLAANFPVGLAYNIVYDTTVFVKASIREVIITLFVAVVLVVLTVYVFLQDIRTTLIPAITIPVALIGTFAVMMGLGFSLNTLTLFGLVLAIGIVVDDAIVVVENTMRLIDEEKLPSKKATEKAMIEVTGPVVATTLVLLAVFVPTAMMGGITGRLYKQFAVTIATATVFSSVNALTLSPALCGMLLRPSPSRRGWFFTLFNKTFDVSTRGYMGVVNVVVRRTGMTLVPFAAMVALMGVGFVKLPTGFIPNEDEGYMFVHVQLPDGATLERTTEVLDRVNEILLDTPGVAHAITLGGFSLLDNLNIPNAGACIPVLAPWDERKDQATQIQGILGTLSRRFSEIQDGIVFAFTPPPIRGLGSAGGFEFQLQDRGGAGIFGLETSAKDLVFGGGEDPLLTRMNNSFRANVPQLFLEVDRTKTQTLGVSLDTVFNALQAYLGSMYVNDFNLFGRVYRVMIQADQKYRSRIEDIDRIEVRNRDGAMIPLSTLVSVRDTVGPQTIFHYNLYPSATITGEAAAGHSSGEAITAMEKLAERTLPPSMGYEWSGVTYQQLVAGNQAPFIFGLAVVLVFLFLAAQYESWSIPFAVIFSIPLALLGAVAGVWMRSYDVNIYTQIGIVLLIGLSSKSAIMIVEFAKQLRAEGRSTIEAAVQASRLRFRPILMTAFSFILGVLPLVIATGAGAVSRRSLGTAVFAGMLVATVLGVFFIPVLYVVVQTLTDRLGRRKTTAGQDPDAKR